jgi:hypothetical protein
MTHDLCIGGAYHMVRIEAEVLGNDLHWRRQAKRMHAKDSSLQTRVALSAEGRGLFNRHPRRNVWYSRPPTSSRTPGGQDNGCQPGGRP